MATVLSTRRLKSDDEASQQASNRSNETVSAMSYYYSKQSPRSRTRTPTTIASRKTSSESSFTASTIKTTETIKKSPTTERLRSSKEILGQASRKAVGTLEYLLSNLSQSFKSFRDSIRLDSIRKKRGELDPFLCTMDFRRRVYEPFGILDSVDHSALTQGLSLPKLNGSTLQRFLIARKYDVDKAFAMLMAYVEWRKDFPEEGIREEEVETSLEHDKVHVMKRPDKGGHICIVISVRKHNMRDVSLEETERYIVYVIDKVRGTFLTGKRSMDKMTCIIDLQRIAMRNLDGEGLKAILTVLQNYYPENLACMVFWKPPTIFWIVYKMVVPFVDPKTKSKITMANTMADLESRFCAKDLPTTIGGKGAEDAVFVRIQDLRRAEVDY